MMSTNKRTIEVFTAGCPVCRETLEQVRQSVAGCGCEVIERRCEGETCCAPAQSYGIRALPSIVVDGKVAFEGRPTPEQTRVLLAA
jgi:hypothetical protein